MSVTVFMRKLPQRTKYFFDQFINAANEQILHPLDWRRFYHFIHAAHQGRTKLSADELKKLLLEAGFSDENADELASIYHHGRGLLKRKLPFNYNCEWTG